MTDDVRSDTVPTDSTIHECCPTCGCKMESGSYVKWRYHTDPEFKADMIKRSVAYVKERRQRDPEFNEHIKELWRQHARKNAQDPEKQAKRKEYLKEYYKRKKDAKTQSSQPHETI